MATPPPSRKARLPLFLVLVVVVTVVVVIAAVTGYLVTRPSSTPGSPTSATAEYPATFEENGLPSGASWSVSIDGANHSSSNASIVVRLAAGSYPYSVAPIPGFVTPGGGTLVVAAPSVEVSVAFTVFEFSVEFSESGLPAGTSWTVEVGGQHLASSSAELLASEPNGTYPFSVGPVANYTSTPLSGTVVVDGRDVSAAIAFAANTTNTTPPPSQSTITIGGSTSVYPFAAEGATWFEQNNSDVVISVNQGGSGAGMVAVCAGAIDIGLASVPVNASELVSTYGCPSSDESTILVTPVAYDAVDVVIASANVHGLLSLNYDTLNLIYEHASTTTSYAEMTTLDGQALPAGYPTTGTPLEWDQIPASVQGATIGSLIEEPESAGAGAGGAACAPPFSADICAATPGSSATPCGWSVCAGGSTAAEQTAVIDPVERSDESGTTLTFESRLLGYTSSTGWASSYSGLGFSGCGSNNILADCGISVPTTGTGDPEVLAAVAANANAIGYASDGLARVASGIGIGGIVPFLADGEAVGSGLASGNTTGLSYGGVAPSLGPKGSVAAGIGNSSTGDQYVGWRPFEFVTLTSPSGIIQRFYEFILDPANNLALASYAAVLSIYSVQ